HGTKRPQCRTKPSIQYVFILVDIRAAALFTSCWIFFGNRNVLALTTMPSRDTVSPPKLARNTPILNDLHPVKICLCPRLRLKADRPALNHSLSWNCEFSHAHKPLF